MVAGLLLIGLGVFGFVWASSTSTFSQSISAGTLSVDIVNGSGASVGSPSVSFPSYSFSFDLGTSTATLGTGSEAIRVSNPTTNAAWTLTLAPTSTAGHWYSGTAEYDWKSNDHSGGAMQIDPTGGTIAGVGSCSESDVDKGSKTYFSSGTLSVTILSSTAAATSCRWDFTGVEIKQEIPASQPAGSYQIGMNVTVS